MQRGTGTACAKSVSWCAEIPAFFFIFPAMHCIKYMQGNGVKFSKHHGIVMEALVRRTVTFLMLAIVLYFENDDNIYYAK